MFIIFTEPKKFTKSYTEACQIADAHYQSTGEIVAVENVNNAQHISKYDYANYPELWASKLSLSEV